MKFKPSHSTTFMIEQAQREADGYFELSRPGSNNTDAVSVQVRRDARNVPHVTWAHRVPGNKGLPAEVTRDAVATTLENWRNQ